MSCVGAEAPEASGHAVRPPRGPGQACVRRLFPRCPDFERTTLPFPDGLSAGAQSGGGQRRRRNPDCNHGWHPPLLLGTLLCLLAPAQARLTTLAGTLLRPPFSVRSEERRTPGRSRRLLARQRGHESSGYRARSRSGTHPRPAAERARKGAAAVASQLALKGRPAERVPAAVASQLALKGRQPPLQVSLHASGLIR